MTVVNVSIFSSDPFFIPHVDENQGVIVKAPRSLDDVGSLIRFSDLTLLGRTGRIPEKARDKKRKCRQLLKVWKET